MMSRFTPRTSWRGLAFLLLLVGLSPSAMAGKTQRLTLYNKIMASAGNPRETPQRKMGDTLVAHLHVFATPNVNQQPVATADMSFVVTVPATIENPVETRLFHAVFTFNDEDTLVMDGLSLANIANDWMNQETSVRSIVGGTGKYRGARGTARYTRIEENLFKMDLTFKTD